MRTDYTRILVVDDEIGYRKVLNNALTERGFIVKTAASGEEALEELKKHAFAIALIDMKLPGGIDGLELLQRIKGTYNTSVLIMTAYGGIETAVEAMRRGALNYITKPFNLDEILLNIDRLIEQQKIIDENRYLHSELEKVYGLKKIIGSSREIQKVLDMISRVAFSSATILITGESGTGKELVARAIHFTGNRKDKKFIVINCATLSENLLESELFGHVKGAFTGAIRDKKGLFEEADSGTLFMDEIGDIPKSVQAKILRVLQEGEFIPVGDTATKRVDVRIIAATNQDLLQCVQEKEFREDLYYRLNVINIKMPPLRDRKEDIPLLVKHFIEKYNKKENKQIKGINQDVEKEFYNYTWPGNVRELENVIERAVTLTNEDIISLDTISSLVKKEGNSGPTEDELLSSPYKEARRKALDSFNVKYITKAINKTEGNVTNAAKESGIERQYLQRMLKRYNIKSKDIF
ncbi:MAG TPA: sigma-54-dependent transcriptional regulator [Candidatus Wujingus californicus]|uniref:sigma-54-dependent transcriptional regulator n=1 Tax=Candidatus Wujingus californicus TaxID=3367618 RepID=UPI001DDAC669|nr:sigma-54-dependent Fis family transcriptional regulator [Planctomycetota bacterium]MDO8131605.1 sigma-54 dependent transcriptional regulator [Candidatus Brocadiales bacterium]